MTLDLRGRLEAVQLMKAESENLVLGKLFNETLIPVSNAGNYLNQRCLVRFDGYCGGGSASQGYFISHQVPPDFRGLAHDEYILCAEWRAGMQKKSEFPAFTELLYYYQPGNFGHFFYFSRRFGRRNRVIITKREIRPSGRSMGKAVRNLQAIEEKLARLIVVESSEQMEELEDIVRVHGLTPVVMEPLE